MNHRAIVVPVVFVVVGNRTGGALAVEYDAGWPNGVTSDERVESLRLDSKREKTEDPQSNRQPVDAIAQIHTIARSRQNQHDENNVEISKADLDLALQQIAQEHSKLDLVIRAESEAPYRFLAEVFDLCRQHGLEIIRLSTIP